MNFSLLKNIYTLNNSSATNKKHNNKIINSIKGIVLGLLRLTSSYIQYFYSSLGVMIISDRWPSVQENSMDGPKFSYEKNSLLINYLNKIQQKIYFLMPKAHLTIFLKTDIKNILKRNRERENIESEEFIIQRYEKSIKAKPKSKKLIIYENNNEEIHATNDCIKIINSYINKKY